jgi:23S rRNA pseudouridine2605 synthase
MPAKKLPSGDRPLKTLERLISKSGLGSRREARSWIAAGRATVNGGVVLDPDHWIDLERDEVAFDGKPLPEPQRLYLLLHKPAGYLTTRRDPEGRPTVYDLLGSEHHNLIYVGRLDFDTSGLLIMTNDSGFAEHLTNPEHHVPKTYLVETATDLDEDQLQLLRDGIELSDGMTRPAEVKRTGDDRGNFFELTITEGRNRQVRRMIEALGSRVVSLVRISIGPASIGDLRSGETRALTPREVALLSGRM